MKRVLGSLAVVTLLSGCANFWSWYPDGAPPPAATPAPEPVPERPVGPNEYVVRRGDTLYSIAFRNQLDYRDVAKWNGVGSNYLIRPGQVLRLTSPTSQHIVSDDGGIV
ncbi:MAG TPA: LysM domain-containing protein, partial [Nevskiaceae bacterium]|nr:LysM domain-containing protein [Nevskiaceae bacterium]